jgi:hypothetical protein
MMSAQGSNHLSESDERSESSGSKNDLSTSNATSTSGEGINLEEKERLYQNESKQVKRLKNIVLLIMVVAAIAVSTIVYFITKNSEINQFHAMYEGAAEKLLCTYFVW